ncbi:hypothetical protein BY458DRAFT_491240 [Sporodiniella umbellata]|nr:hypothetical protein BY458DRAFT_491240 [Sporodiniella umbellata]
MLFIQIAVITLFINSVFGVFSRQNDPRIERWNRMKIALPDSLLPEEELAPAEVITGSHSPLHRDQSEEQIGYKSFGLPPVIKQIAPLPPIQDAIASKSVSWQGATPTAKPYNKFAAIEKQNKAIPIVFTSIENRFKEKQIVGLDNQGNIQHLNIPVHNRF